MTEWDGYVEDAIRTRAVDEFIVFGQTLRMKQDANGNRIYYNERESAIENCIRFLHRDPDLDPKELTLEQNEQLERLKREIVYIFGK